MSNRLKRGLAPRLAVGLGVLVFPLLATGVAQASIAGATPAQFSVPPNLRSATITSGYKNIVEVCFDKTINGVLVAGGFKLGGYRAGNVLSAAGASIDQNNTNCAVVVFPSATTFDEQQYTFLEVSAGTVFVNSTTNPNLADSVALTGSTSHSGTTGVTTGPNLVGVLAPDSVHLATNSLTFVFDKTAHVVSAGDFAFESAAGQICDGAAILGGQDSTTVTIGFGGPPSTNCVLGLGTANVGQAVRALVGNGGVTADQDIGAPFTAPTEMTIMPNCASPCATSHPDVTVATLGSNQDQIVFTFDKNVVVASQVGFHAELANGNTVTSTGATLTGANQVTATFGGNLSNKAEFGVEASVDFGAVFAADNLTLTGAGLPGAVNIGGNAGAFAAGFTSAPDSFGVSINHASGQVVVNLDDRITALNAAALTLYTAQGLPIAIAPTSESFNSSAGPGPLAVTLQYSPSGITNATALQIGQGAFTGPVISGVAADQQSVPQIDDPPNSAAILKAYKAYQAKHQKHHKHMKHHR